jgi:NAD(P)H-dependent flavin oxidoreductase YrpB (nitropropane dioxygenase family)
MLDAQIDHRPIRKPGPPTARDRQSAQFGRLRGAHHTFRAPGANGTFIARHRAIMASRNSSGDRESGMTRRHLLGVLGGLSGAAIAGGSARADDDDRSGAEAGGDHRPRRCVSLDTRLVTEYGVRYPIVSAGMAFVGLPDLAAAVTSAGGIGVYGASPEPPPVVDARVADLASRVSGPFGVDFIIATTPMGDFTTQAHIDVVAGRGVPIVVFHFDLPPAAWVDQLHEAGTRVWVQVGSPEVARRAVDVGADLIIAQGRSAGGHNHNQTIPTLPLVRALRAQLPGEILLLAAGGVADGLSLVAALEAGADGAWMGTRFLASAESYAHPEYKSRIVAAKGRNATAFTTLFGPEFPGQPQRVLANRAVTSPVSTEPPVIGKTLLFPGVVNVPVEMPKYSALVPTRDTTGDLEEMDMPAGSESVLHIASIRSAADIVADIVAEAERVIAHGSDRDD